MCDGEHLCRILLEREGNVIYFSGSSLKLAFNNKILYNSVRDFFQYLLMR